MILPVITWIYKLKIKSELTSSNHLDHTLDKEHLSNGELAIFPTNTQRPFSQVALLFYQRHLNPLRTSLIGHHKTRCHTWEKTQLMIFIFKWKTKLWKPRNKEQQLELLCKLNWEITSKTKLLMSGASDTSPTSTQKQSFQVLRPSSPRLLHQLKISLTGHPRTKCPTRERTLLMTFIFKQVTMKSLLKMLDYKLLRCKLKWTELLLMLMPRELNNKLIMKITFRKMIPKPNSKVSWTPNKVYIDLLQPSVLNPIWRKWPTWLKSLESQWLQNWCNLVTMKLSQMLS